MVASVVKERGEQVKAGVRNAASRNKCSGVTSWLGGSGTEELEVDMPGKEAEKWS